VGLLAVPGYAIALQIADYMWSFMSAVFSLAVADGELSVNPCAKGGRLYDGSRVDVIWTSPQVGAFLHQRRFAHMHLPLLIGLWTGQREGDILRLKWSAYDGSAIRLKQRKGKRRGKKKNVAAIVIIPIAGPLKAALDAALAVRKAAKVSPLHLEEEMICLNSEGEPWREGRAGYNGFISSFRKAKEEAGLTGVNFLTCGVRPSHGSRSPAVRCLRFAPSPATATRRRTQSWRPTTCIATQRLPGMPSANWRHSRPA
jgi:integrase